MSNELEQSAQTQLTVEKQNQPITYGALNSIITEILRPVLEPIGEMLKNSTAALEQLSAAQSIQNDRLEALEKQIRLQTPVNSKQVKYLNDAIRARARACCTTTPRT